MSAFGARDAEALGSIIVMPVNTPVSGMKDKLRTRFSLIIFS
jgi:hypothetical protein